MSLKKVGEVKADKGFKIWDLIIYGAIIALVAVLFIVVFATRDTSPLKGIRIYVANEVVYEYDFENGEISRKDCVEVEDGEESLTLKVNCGNNRYNTVVIYKSGSVKVTQANCPKKDCVYTPEIKDNSGFIHCLSHGLKVLPYDFDIDNGNLII